MKLILVAFLALISSAHSVPIVSGDADSLYAEFFFDFGPNDFGDTISGAWDGGTFIFGGTVSVIHTGFQIEMHQNFWLKTFWDDGWIPDALGNQRIGTNAFGPFTLLLFTHHPPSTPVPDYGPNHLQYLLAGSAFLDLTLLPDRSGHGTITYDIARTPMISSSRLLSEQVSAVPESGSSLTLLALALCAFMLKKLPAKHYIP